MNFESLFDYHRRYPNDKFRHLSERLFTDLHMQKNQLIQSEAEKKQLLEEISKLQDSTHNPQILSLHKPISPPPTLKNKFQILQNPYSEDSEFNLVTQNKPIKPNRRKHVNHRKNPKPNQPIPENMTKTKIPNFPVKNRNSYKKIPFSNIAVIGDSHARKIAALISERTSHKTKVTGECRPGAGLLDIVPSSTFLSHLKPDCIVLVAGTNDVAAGRQSIIFRHLEDILKTLSETSRVVICTLPARHDLHPASPVHDVISLVNNYIEELCIRLQGVELLNIKGISRTHFTNHGMHLRASGKSVLADLVVEALSHCQPLPSSCQLNARPTQNQRPANPSSDATAGLGTTQTTYVLPYETYAQAAKQNSSTLESTLSTKTVHQTSDLQQTDCSQLNNPTSFLGNPLQASTQN